VLPVRCWYATASGTVRTNGGSGERVSTLKNELAGLAELEPHSEVG
jgi:hypothetical protein